MADHLYSTRPNAPDNRLLWLTAALSLLAHLLLFGVGGFSSFSPFAAEPAPRQLSIRLTRQASPTAPATARAAEENHGGAGNTAAPDQLLSRSERHRQAGEPAPTPPVQAPTPLNPITRPEPARPLQPTPAVSAASLMSQVRDLANSSGDNAVADNDRETGRDGADLGEAARGYSWARYQADWQLKVERIGNRNYPEEARRQGLHGAVTLEVTIAADGSLRGQRVSRSSGNAILDEAARRIIDMAAPFSPFPPALAKRFPTQRLSLRFIFTRDNLLSSQ
ncbi:energy transducer TonB [Chromobacterium vaccinii]|uniref:energy transducer TonB n=1 Tax=Chromobacterium vaccinii TaxID=1108595 RepID=UPI003C72503A